MYHTTPPPLLRVPTIVPLNPCDALRVGNNYCTKFFGIEVEYSMFAHVSATEADRMVWDTLYLVYMNIIPIVSKSFHVFWSSNFFLTFLQPSKYIFLCKTCVCFKKTLENQTRNETENYLSVILRGKWAMYLQLFNLVKYPFFYSLGHKYYCRLRKTTL